MAALNNILSAQFDYLQTARSRYQKDSKTAAAECWTEGLEDSSCIQLDWQDSKTAVSRICSAAWWPSNEGPADIYIYIYPGALRAYPATV